MLCENRKFYQEILTLEKSEYLDKLKKLIPKIKGTTPNFGLPKWKHLPLESKIPMIPGLEDVILSRRKVGESLRVPFVDNKQFDTSDPYNYEARLPYEGLHDPHLSRFFREAVHLRDCLIKSGIITPELDVKCNLVAYNSYRQYLRKMCGKFIKKELAKIDEIQKEKLMLETVEKMTKAKIKKIERYEKVGGILEARKRKRELFELAVQNKQKVDDERLEVLNFMKRQMNIRKILEARIKKEYKKEKLADIAIKHQQAILHVLKKMHERDHRLKVFFEQSHKNKEKAKREAFTKKFETRKKFQEEAIEKEAQLKECAEKFKQSFLEEYGKMMNRRWEKLHELYLRKRRAIKYRPKIRKKPVEKTDCRCLTSTKRHPIKLPVQKTEKLKEAKAENLCEN